MGKFLNYVSEALPKGALRITNYVSEALPIAQRGVSHREHYELRITNYEFLILSPPPAPCTLPLKPCL
ncbi:MAG: hypothetical protein F6K61_13510 [Sphaerospermopsis sp. SIO1G1]|nr:hypothetical protein [Sphaerospermopsis sp. SIO1G1]